MKKYTTYKDSGNKWLGLIPEHWETILLKRIAKVSTGSTPSTLENKYWDNPNYTWYTPADIKEDSIFLGSSERKINHSAIEEGAIREFPKNSVLMVGIGSIGKIGVCPEKCSSNQQILAITFDCCVNPLYGAYYLRASRDYILSKVNAALLAIINQTTTGNLDFLFPPLAEQEAIVAYLDDKVGKIDSSVAAINSQIDDLKAYRQSVISETVTKGLNPNAPMKDSGIQWIGTIPEHWEVNKIKHLFDVISGATPDSSKDEYWDGEITWVTPADFKTPDHYVGKGKRYITRKGYDSCATTIVRAGSIIFSKRAPIGSVALASTELCTNQGCLSCVPQDGIIDSNYYYYTMSAFTDVFEMYGSGTTFKEISATDFSNFKLPVPPFAEQEAIAKYLDEKTSLIDKAIKELEAQRDDLNTLKQSIISEAVTGKIDVRDWKKA